MIGFKEVVLKPHLLMSGGRFAIPICVNGLLNQLPNVNQSQPIRHGSKHYIPKWRAFRALKMIKVELPDFETSRSDDVPPQEVRKKMKERGLLPPRPWMERPYEISCTADIFEPYVPPEGEGKASYISKQGAKQTAEIVSKKSRTYMAFRKIRTFDEDFDGALFAPIAEKIYLDLHKAVAAKDRHLIRTLCTEKAYPEITHNMKLKTVHWKFLHSIEPPKVVYSRCTDIITKENIFAQVTCRFFTKQILAIYDRFGRLAHGSEVVAKDVLEYVVFEKHLADQYGLWRVHGKIIPEWAPTNFETSYRTIRVEKEEQNEKKDPSPKPSSEAEPSQDTSTAAAAATS